MTHTKIEKSQMNNLIVISGCSGGGKSTLLSELQQRGHAVVMEPGRRILHEEMRSGGQALPWDDKIGFLRRILAVALEDYEKAAKERHEWVFFDRGFIDAAAALEELTGEPLLSRLSQSYRYHKRVFLAPPWPEIYVQDAERRHGFDAALREFERLRRAYPSLGYEVLLLPKVSVAERADFVLETLR